MFVFKLGWFILILLFIMFIVIFFFVNLDFYVFIIFIDGLMVLCYIENNLNNNYFLVNNWNIWFVYLIV